MVLCFVPDCTYFSIFLNFCLLKWLNGYSSQYLLPHGTTGLTKKEKKMASSVAIVFNLKTSGLTVLCMSEVTHYQMKKINQNWLHFKMWRLWNCHVVLSFPNFRVSLDRFIRGCSEWLQLTKSWRCELSGAGTTLRQTLHYACCALWCSLWVTVRQNAGLHVNWLVLYNMKFHNRFQYSLLVQTVFQIDLPFSCVLLLNYFHFLLPLHRIL